MEFIKTLKKWINKDKNLKTELLYRLSRDGEQISKFHELCDEKGPTLTLFQTNDEIGGIYTPLSWDTKSRDKFDNETFIFNLTKNEKYSKASNKKVRSIYCSEEHGPWTYCFGFYNVNQMKKIEHGGKGINEVFVRGAEILPNDSNNSKFFEIIEVEVYNIN